METAVVLTTALVFAACGGADDRAGGTKEVGSDVDQSSPQGVATSYVKLVDTCNPEAARKALALGREPAELEAGAMELLTNDVQSGDRPTLDDDLSDTAAKAAARKQFERTGLCDKPDQVPVERLSAQVFEGTDPETGEPLPVDTYIVALRAPEGADSYCSGEDSEGVIAVSREGDRFVIETEEVGGDDNPLERGCVEDTSQ